MCETCFGTGLVQVNQDEPIIDCPEGCKPLGYVEPCEDCEEGDEHEYAAPDEAPEVEPVDYDAPMPGADEPTFFETEFDSERETD